MRFDRSIEASPHKAGWQSGYAAACKAVDAGSIPTPASITPCDNLTRTEARRFLGDVATPREISDACKLDRWLIDRSRRSGTRVFELRELQRIGPNSTRKKQSLDAAVAELVEAGRVRYIDVKRIEVRPELLGSDDAGA